MKLELITSNANSLKKDIISLIEDEELQTWEIHPDTNDKYLKHTGQWGEKGVIKLKSDITNKKLEVQVLKFKRTEESLEEFEGYYLGRFCELIFVNFENRFNSIDKK
ncbi:MAG: hypothetical protein PHS59_18590 [Paludibacter sp.]|nr:hypothetical protein [Paludibacter sp.]